MSEADILARIVKMEGAWLAAEARIEALEKRADAKEQWLTKVETRIPLTVGERLVALEDAIDELKKEE